MATYDISAQAAGNPKPGAFWMSAVLNFTQHNLETDDIIRLIKLQDGWIVRDSYWRQSVLTTAGVDIEIGVSDSTKGIHDQTVPETVTDWAQGSYTPAAMFVPNDEEYIEVKVTDAGAANGVVLVMIEVVAGQDQNEPSDMNIDD